MASTLHELQRYDRMLEVVRDLRAAEGAMFFDEQRANAARLHATALQHLGRLDEAIEVTDRGIAAAPEDARLAYAKAGVLVAKGDANGALRCLARALELDPGLRGAIGVDPGLEALRTNAKLEKLLG
jgi:tetratricopeptide (TPR) repeat protein